MRIDGNSPIYSRPLGNAKGARGQSGSFAPEMRSEVPRQTGGTGGAAASAGIDALLALQAVEDATTGRRRNARRGHQLLDTLEDIRADLLVGRVSEGRLNRAVVLLGQAKSRSGDAVDALVADIELRVRVELAKLGRYPAL